MKEVRNILLVVVCFVIGFLSGCQTIHGFCADGKTAFTVAEKITKSPAEKQEAWDSRMAEDNLHSQLTEAEQKMLEAHRRTERFVQRDPARATAEDKNNIQ